MTDQPEKKKPKMIYCPVVKTETYKEDCLAIQCPYHVFWSGIAADIGGAGCQYNYIRNLRIEGGAE